MLSTDFVLLWCLAAFTIVIGSWLQTTIGFGLAVVAAPVIALIKPSWIPYTLTINAMVLSAINAWTLRPHIEFKRLSIPILVRVPATLFGAWLLTVVSTSWLQMAIGVAVILAALVTASGLQFKATALRLNIASLCSGLMGSTTSIGGPPMALILLAGPPDQIRANLNFYFLASCVLALLSYAYFGLLTTELILIACSFMLPIVIGYWLGLRSRAFIKPAMFKRLVIGFSLFCGIVVLFYSM